MSNNTAKLREILDDIEPINKITSIELAKKDYHLYLKQIL